VLTGGQPGASVLALGGASGEGQGKVCSGRAGQLWAASAAPREKCRGTKSSLNRARHSLCSCAALASCHVCPAARAGRAHRLRPEPRVPGHGTLGCSPR